MLFTAGNDDLIRGRLKKEGRVVETVSLFIHSLPDCGWSPLPKGEVFGVCPEIGDEFMMYGYNNADPKIASSKLLCWKVVRRVHPTTSERAIDMRGMVELFVDLIPGQFDIEPAANG